MHHPTDRIAHTTAFVTPVVEHWLEREIAQWVHPMKDRSDDPSHHERMLLPRSSSFFFINTLSSNLKDTIERHSHVLHYFAIIHSCIKNILSRKHTQLLKLWQKPILLHPEKCTKDTKKKPQQQTNNACWQK